MQQSFESKDRTTDALDTDLPAENGASPFTLLNRLSQPQNVSDRNDFRVISDERNGQQNQELFTDTYDSSQQDLPTTIDPIENLSTANNPQDDLRLDINTSLNSQQKAEENSQAVLPQDASGIDQNTLEGDTDPASDQNKNGDVEYNRIAPPTDANDDTALSDNTALYSSQIGNSRDPLLQSYKQNILSDMADRSGETFSAQKLMSSASKVLYQNMRDLTADELSIVFNVSEVIRGLTYGEFATVGGFENIKKSEIVFANRVGIGSLNPGPIRSLNGIEYDANGKRIDGDEESSEFAEELRNAIENGERGKIDDDRIYSQAEWENTNFELAGGKVLNGKFIDRFLSMLRDPQKRKTYKAEYMQATGVDDETAEQDLTDTEKYLIAARNKKLGREYNADDLALGTTAGVQRNLKFLEERQALEAGIAATPNVGHTSLVEGNKSIQDFKLNDFSSSGNNAGIETALNFSAQSQSFIADGTNISSDSATYERSTINNSVSEIIARNAEEPSGQKSSASFSSSLDSNVRPFPSAPNLASNFTAVAVETAKDENNEPAVQVAVRVPTASQQQGML